MKGIVFTVLQDVVQDELGPQTWDTLVEEAGVSGSYTSLGNYDDVEMKSLVEAASEALEMSQPDVLRWFGEQAIPRFYDQYPELFEEQEGTRSFLRALNDIIHPEVKKLYPGADVPEFEFLDSSEDQVKMAYRSERGLCWLGEGLTKGVANHYGESIEIEQSECLHRGDEQCVYDIHFLSETA